MSKYSKTIAADGLQNMVANIGTMADKSTHTKFVNNQFYSPEELAAMYMGWLPRRIVDLIPDEALKKGWEINCPSWDPDRIDTLNHYVDTVLRLPAQLKIGLKSARIFGGAVLLCITDDRFGSFDNSIPNFLPKGALLGIQAFDAWQCHPATINYSDILAKNYREPIKYSLGVEGVVNSGEENSILGTMVDWTRVRKIDGLFLPWYLKQRNSYWGQSLLASVYDAVMNASSTDASVVSLLFRASVPVLKVNDLAGIVADPESRAAFMDRVNIMNYGASNNNMVIIDSEETLESFEPGSLTNLDGVLERFYVLISAATGIPVTKLIGESARGLNATGDGDLNNYYDALEDYQETTIRPILMDVYKRWIIPSLFDELMPKDFEIIFPPLERVSPDKKQEQDSSFLSMVRDALDAELIDKRVARREIQERKIFRNFGDEDLERIEKEQQENEMDLTDALDAADELMLKKGNRNESN